MEKGTDFQKILKAAENKNFPANPTCVLLVLQSKAYGLLYK